MKTTIVPRITSKQETEHQKKGYQSAHRAGLKAECKAVGTRQVRKTDRYIRKLPKGHWAATHTPKGNVHISREFLNLVPARERRAVKKELRAHELAEHKKMYKK